MAAEKPDAATRSVYELLRDSREERPSVGLGGRDALCTLVEVVEWFLRREYPLGTGHPADADADRLRRAFEAVR